MMIHFSKVLVILMLMVMELWILTVGDQNDDPAAIAVLDGETKNLKWAFQILKVTSEFFDFHGFFDIDANGVREALFGKRTVYCR